MWTDIVLTVASLEAAVGHLDRHLTYKPAQRLPEGRALSAVLQYTHCIIQLIF